MHKKHRTTRKNMKGAGWFDNMWYSLKQGTSDFWNKTKNATSGLTSSFSTTSPTNYSSSTNGYQQMSTPYQTQGPTNYQANYGNQTSINQGFGGKRGTTRKRHLRGGYTDNTPTTGLAITAAPFSGPTAQPHNWIGGKSRRKNKGKKMNTRRRY